MVYQEATKPYTWGDLLPLPEGKKHPPPGGYTGEAGRPVTDVERDTWATHTGNLALRLPDGVVGIDVDEYGDKHGLDTIQSLATELGPLPLAWLSTGRDPRTGSGIHFYRYPGGKLAGQAGESVDVIQHGHRYAVVWPSVVQSSSGDTLEYRWWKWNGTGWDLAERPPLLEELPELPAPWVEWLASRAAASAGPAAPAAERDQLLAELVTDPRPGCGALQLLAEDGARKLLEAGEGGRHDVMTGAVLALVAQAAEGHTGFPEALTFLEGAWTEAIGQDPSRAGEFERMVATAAAKVAGKYPKAIRAGMIHYCERGTPAPVHTPEDVAAVEVTEPPVLPQLPELFDPPVIQEANLAQAALVASCTMHRYATDDQCWYSRDDRRGRWIRQPASPSAWARHILHDLGERTPRGNASADKDTPEYMQSVRWTMLHKSSTRGAVAQLMVDAAPSSGVLAGDMDAERTLLWAGGWCWDLAASVDRPTLAAGVDLLTPHQHSAAVLPRQVPTPRWDAFLEALFPEAEDREYLLGVLGASITGLSDRILGVFHGPTGRGKTSILEIVTNVLGTYATQLDPDLLDAHKSNEFKIMALKGIRLGWVDEGPSNNRQGQERLKALTGGASLRGANKGKDSVSFPATHTLFFTDNRPPEVADPALRNRVRSLEVDGDPAVVARTVAAIRRDEQEWLETEGPGVLAALMSWAGRYLKDRSVAAVPEHVAVKLEALGREQDPILNWMDERTSPDGESLSQELYQDFREYSMRSGVPRSLIPSVTSWGRSLTDLGVLPRKSMGRNFRPLVIKQFGTGMGFPNGPEAYVQGPQTTLPEPGTTLPGPSLPSLKTDDSGPQGHGTVTGGGTAHVATEHGGTVNPPWNPQPSLGETPSQVPSRDTRDSRDSSIVISKNDDEEEEKNIRGRIGGKTLPGVPDPGSREAGRDAAEAPADRPTEAPTKATRTKAPAKPKPTPAEKLQAVHDQMAAEALQLPALKVRGSQEPLAVALADADALLESLAGLSVGLDVEHTGYPVGHRLYQLRTIQLGNREWALVLDAQDPAHQELATRTLDQASEIVAHSATADVSLVAELTGRDSGPWWDKTTDTAVVTALADPAITGAHKRLNPLALKPLAKHVLGDTSVIPEADKERGALFRRGKWLTDTEADTPAERSGWANVPSGHPVMVTYAASDVLDTAALKDALPAPAPELLHRERRVQKMTARLAERGLRLDGERVDQMMAEAETLRDRYRAELADLGVSDPASNVQVGQALTALGAELPRTEKSGQFSTAAEVVEKLATQAGPAQALAAKLLEYRGQEKLLSTYLIPAAHQVHQGDGRSRPTILTMGAVATGRMSSARPNIQNVVRPTKAESKPGGGGGMRGMYVADPGHLLISADFSSVEVRIAAAVTGDATLAHMVREGIDLHAEVTKLAWGMDPEHPQFGDTRSLAKRAVFLNLYGGGLGAMAKALGPHADKAQSVVDALRAVTPGLVEWDRGLRESVRSGRLAYWVHPSGRVAYFNKDLPHKALNLVVQGYGRELLVDSMLRWEDMHPGCTIIPVHDELLIQVPEDQAEAWTVDLQEAMTTTIGQGVAMVPIVAEADPATHRWGTVE